MLRNSLLAIALGSAFALPAHAESINQKAAINPDGKLEVKNVRGLVRITVWEKNEVEVTGTLGEGSKFFLDGSPAAVSVRVDNPDSKGWFNWGVSGPRSDTTLEIKVPRGVTPAVHAVSADVEITGLDSGRIDAESVSGDVKVNSKAQRVELQSVSGDVRFEGASSRSNFETVSGDIVARGISGDVSVESVSGEARIEAAGPIREFKGQTVSGDASLTAALAPQARIKIESMSGDVRLSLPADVSASLEANTFSGTIRTAFGKVDHEEYGSGQKLKTRAGSGDAEVDVETFSGDVELERR